MNGMGAPLRLTMSVAIQAVRPSGGWPDPQPPVERGGHRRGAGRRRQGDAGRRAGGDPGADARAMAGAYLTDEDIGEWKGYAPLIWDPRADRRGDRPAAVGSARRGGPGAGRHQRHRGHRVRPLAGGPPARPSGLRTSDGRGSGRAPHMNADAAPVIDVAALRAGVERPARRSPRSTGLHADRLLRRHRARRSTTRGRRCSTPQPRSSTSRRRKARVGDGRRQGLVPVGTAATRRDPGEERLDLGLQPTDRWPALRRLRRHCPTVPAQALALAADLLAGLAVALELDPTFFAARMRTPQCVLRMMHYLPAPAASRRPGRTPTTGRSRCWPPTACRARGAPADGRGRR